MWKSMIERVLIEDRAKASIAKEMASNLVTETGGILIGYRRGSEIRVTAASGPGPKSERNLTSVLVDGEFAQKFTVDAFSASNGKVDYVGDWHCHLNFLIGPSDLDLEAMRIVSESGAILTATPITMIWCRWTKRCASYVYESNLILREIECVTL